MATMDLLDDILRLVEARPAFSSRFTAGREPWRVDFTATSEPLKFSAISHGTCLLRVGHEEPRVLAEGDCFLLSRPVDFTLASDLTAAATPASEAFDAVGGSAHVGGSGAEPTFSAIGGSFTFGGPASRLLQSLPDVVVLTRDDAAASGLPTALQMIDFELRTGGPGWRAVAQHLGMVLLVHSIRRHIEQADELPASWLLGMADPVVAAALTAIHREPAFPWTVAELARQANVSRSTMAQKFRTTVGTGPIDYLVDWRMDLAERQLAATGDNISMISRRVGYSSESTFSTAFKRLKGYTPSEARRRSRRSSSNQ